MIWYIVTFVVGATFGVAGFLYLLPRAKWLLRYVEKMVRQIGALDW